MIPRRRPSAHDARTAAYEAALLEVKRVCASAAAGDLEPRVMRTEGAVEHPLVEEVRHELNRVLDRTDAFVRESAASLSAASQGFYARQFLLAGMPGSFREAATTINTARGSIAEAAQRVDAASTARLALADEFEANVLSMAEQVAAAATELSASAAGLAESTGAAMTAAGRATDTVGSLESSSQEIRQVVALIVQIAAQTKLLALNATIEAARAGEAGKGFAVVASEVKTLADETGKAAEQVTRQVEAVQAVSEESTAVMHGIGATVGEMGGMVEAIGVAVDGGVHGPGGDGSQGLSQLAEAMRADVLGFLGQLRD